MLQKDGWIKAAQYFHIFGNHHHSTKGKKSNDNRNKTLRAPEGQLDGDKGQAVHEEEARDGLHSCEATVRTQDFIA